MYIYKSEIKIIHTWFYKGIWWNWRLLFKNDSCPFFIGLFQKFLSITKCKIRLRLTIAQHVHNMYIILTWLGWCICPLQKKMTWAQIWVPLFYFWVVSFLPLLLPVYSTPLPFLVSTKSTLVIKSSLTCKAFNYTDIVDCEV